MKLNIDIKSGKKQNQFELGRGGGNKNISSK